MTQLQLNLVLHHHQPSGNLPEMFARAYERAYLPFIEALERVPEMRLTLHYSGALLDFFVAHHPDFVRRLRKLLERGQIELLGGAMYEPILSAIPEKDRLGQIKYQSEVQERLFGAAPLGVWLAERVWEPHFPAVLNTAGVKYTLLDDTQFEQAGFERGELHQGFLTEEDGKVVELFPMNTRLRSHLPFDEPQRFISELRGRAEEFERSSGDFPPGFQFSPRFETPLERSMEPGLEPSKPTLSSGHLLTLGEDGEKFGLWEGTFTQCYENGWLERFFHALLAESSWLTLTTLSRHRRQFPPHNRAYVPSSAYAEMGEWSMPTRHQRELHGRRRITGGGMWRNFLVRYPEVALMQKRMAYVSHKLHNTARAPHSAFEHLWKAQVGDPYWHSTHGGTYHNFLRFEVYRNLIEAENAIEPRKYSWLEIGYADLDADGIEEVIAESHTMNLYFRARGGGMLTEWDFRPRAVNLLDSFSRRLEPYHELPGVDRSKLIFDRYLRRSLIDHFLGGDLSLESFSSGDYLELGDFVDGDFEAGKYRNRVTLRRMGQVRGPGGVPVAVELKKSVRILPKECKLEVEYRVTNHGDWDIITRFGSEWNFALLAGDAPDRYFTVGGRKVGLAGSTLEHREVTHTSVVDEWSRVAVDFQFEGREATLWHTPIETWLPEHAGGPLKAVYQASTVMPVWDLDLPKGRSRRIAYSVQVREL